MPDPLSAGDPAGSPRRQQSADSGAARRRTEAQPRRIDCHPSRLGRPPTLPAEARRCHPLGLEDGLFIPHEIVLGAVVLWFVLSFVVWLLTGIRRRSVAAYRHITRREPPGRHR